MSSQPSQSAALTAPPKGERDLPRWGRWHGFAVTERVLKAQVIEDTVESLFGGILVG